MNNESKPRKPFSGRGLASLIVVWAFVIMTVSGIVLYVVPGGPPSQGSGASSVLSKGDWKAMHIITAFAFVIAAAFHVYFNWATLLSHLKSKATRRFTLTRELVIATVLTVLLVAGTLAGVPPLSTIAGGFGHHGGGHGPRGGAEVRVESPQPAGEQGAASVDSR